jgi:hypothetical protein
MGSRGYGYGGYGNIDLVSWGDIDMVSRGILIW